MTWRWDWDKLICLTSAINFAYFFNLHVPAGAKSAAGVARVVNDVIVYDPMRVVWQIEAVGDRQIEQVGNRDVMQL
jgi:hypothetical protein